MRFLPFSCPLVIGLVVSASADVIVQTDWSEGPGASGPVPQWGSSFDSSVGISWLSVPGQIALSSVPTEAAAEHLIDASVDGICSVFGVDVDGDGDNDILAAVWNEDSIIWWENDGGSPPGWSRQLIDGEIDGASHVHACDMDFDGDTDVLGTGWNADDIVWWRNDGGSPIQWVKQTIDGSFDGASWVHAADLDNDSDMDVVGAAGEAHDIVWWENAGGDPIQWNKWIVDHVFVSARCVRTADIDGDGNPDLIGAALNYNDIAWWRNNGGDPLSWSKHLIDGSFEDPPTVFPADIDGDGDSDVVAAGHLVDMISWWRNDGEAALWHEETIAGVDGAWYAVPVDLDGDGDIDVMGSAREADTVEWWQNQGGNPVAWIEHSLAEGFDGASALDATDIDCDGDLDVIASATSADKAVWWEVSEFSTAGEITSSILDIQGRPLEARIDWVSYEPANTSLNVRVRTSDDSGNMGTWSDFLPFPGCQIGPLQRYMQYQLVFESSNEAVSPVLTELALQYDVLSGHGERSDPTRPSLVWSPDPGGGIMTVRFEIPAPGHVDLGLFDLNGRRAFTFVNGHLTAGVHVLDGSRVEPGVYVCRLDAGGSTTTEPVVVLQ